MFPASIEVTIKLGVADGISQWAAVEECLADIFAEAMHSPVYATAAMALESIRGFEAKLGIISDTLAFTLNDMPVSVRQSWKRLCKALREANKMRNKLAHGRFVTVSLATGEVAGWMPFYSSTKIANATRTTDAGVILAYPNAIEILDHAHISECTKVFKTQTSAVVAFLELLRAEMRTYRQTDWFKRINRPKSG